jgi:alpha-1,6-mannosyltransferase
VVGRAADRYLRYLYSRFDVVQAPSRLIAERLRRSGIENVVVQPLGVDGDIFHPSRREGLLRAQLGLRADTRLLVFAGRMAREKQIPLLLETFAELGAPYHLLIVGGDERRRLSANATLLPYEHDSMRLAGLLASADALVHAGAQETFGMIVIEAMACGLPVVGVRGGAVPELIDDGIGALADAGDARALAEAIDGLYERDLAQLGRQARLRVERRYAWSSTFALQLDRYVRLRRREFDPALEVADATGVP